MCYENCKHKHVFKQSLLNSRIPIHEPYILCNAGFKNRHKLCVFYWVLVVIHLFMEFIYFIYLVWKYFFPKLKYENLD